MSTTPLEKPKDYKESLEKHPKVVSNDANANKQLYSEMHCDKAQEFAEK